MSTSKTETSTRRVEHIVPTVSTLEGGGFEVYRPFPGPLVDWIDPFLLLDELPPNHIEPGKAIGAPDHPHRGFETVTYIVEGEVEHRDSAGNHGIIGPGEVQWMTAGDGIVHSEMPSTRMQTEGGVSHGLQLWVNLPASLRRTTPKYQALGPTEIVSVKGTGWSAEVVAGKFFGVTGPAETHTPIGYARVSITPGTDIRIPVDDGHTALVYAIGGSAEIGETREHLAAHNLAVLERTGGDVLLSVGSVADVPFDCMVLTGLPIDEPMVRYGPFVMNTAAEIEEAIHDFNAGRMGSIPAVGST